MSLKNKLVILSSLVHCFYKNEEKSSVFIDEQIYGNF